MSAYNMEYGNVVGFYWILYLVESATGKALYHVLSSGWIPEWIEFYNVFLEDDTQHDENT